MKKGNPEPLTPELQAELNALAAMPDSEIDTADMPPINDWSEAVRATESENTIMSNKWSRNKG